MPLTLVGSLPAHNIQVLDSQAYEVATWFLCGARDLPNTKSLGHLRFQDH